MSTPQPPTLPAAAKPSRKGLWIALAIVLFGAGGFTLNFTGHSFYRPFDVPTGAMAPTIEAMFTMRPDRCLVMVCKTALMQ